MAQAPQSAIDMHGDWVVIKNRLTFTLSRQRVLAFPAGSVLSKVFFIEIGS